MKKKTTILMLALMIILTSTLTLIVNAADVTVTISSNRAQVNAGDTFEVTMNVSCEEGINGLQGTVNYDETKLELVNIAVADTTKWLNLGENTELAIIHNLSNIETSAEIVKVTLKVKETAEIGTAKVTISDIKLDSDAASNSIKQVGTKEFEVSIVEKTSNSGQIPEENEGNNPDETPKDKTLTGIEIEKEPTKNTYKVGDKFDKTGMKILAKYSDGTSKEITKYTYTPSESLKATDKKITISYTEGEVTKTVAQDITVINTLENNTEDNKEDTKDDSKKIDKEIPKAGVEKNIILVIGIVLITTIASYLGYKKYKNI